ncbi:tenascin-like [Lingula anatina]|uniref:Tenascin-like n=1 Tax=Lingula anatina TaxID=7574 RepID=A0A2R2MSM3_LINAN|nr:tenascin-like [Lingula anatina]|eukprot:XP_023933244.1 tenascin-like [Lingula anatina]
MLYRHYPNIQAAETVCQGKGLEGVLLQECVYDIVVTKDITFSNQETYELGCPGQCNGKGRCVNSTCQCNHGWTGTDCSIGSCGACVSGVCDSGFCVCTVGWEGTACDQKGRLQNLLDLKKSSDSASSMSGCVIVLVHRVVPEDGSYEEKYCLLKNVSVGTLVGVAF